jgi:HSP20 family protein
MRRDIMPEKEKTEPQALEPAREEPGGFIPALAGPWSLMRRLMNDMDNMLEELGAGGIGRLTESSRALFPRLDMHQEGDQLVIRADLPGVDKNAVEISITDEGLVISGERRHVAEQAERDYYRVERGFGRFRRVIPLPPEADAESAVATLEDGVLELKLNAVPRKTGKRVEIQEKGQQTEH